MIRRRTLRALGEALTGLTAVGVVVLSVAGCSSPPATVAPPAAPQASPIPPRPEVLRLDQASNDPCGLLDAGQVAQLVASPGTRGPVDGEPNSYACLWMRSPVTVDGAWFARPDLHHDAAYYLSSSAHVVKVGGFGTVQTYSAVGEPDDNCQLYIDTADGQSLEVQYATIRVKTRMTHQLACQLASQAAEQMLTNLEATTGTASGTG
jgi:Protein of unknown function (DUF3558)